MDYLGNKAGFADQIVRLISRHVTCGEAVSDVFAGTGAVSVALARAGYDVVANDHLPLSMTWTRARLLGADATFAGLESEVGPLGRDPMRTVLDALGELPGVQGWVTRNYTPRSRDITDVERRYLTEANGRRVDAVRLQLRAWHPRLTAAEHALLMTSLVEAVTEVSNVAGTYGCYLKHWKPAATRQLRMRVYHDVATSGSHTVICGDAERAAAESPVAAMYADPPYTKRQYAAYYHLLNSIASDEEPALTGSTGLPDWRPLASDWCYRRHAPRALECLVAKSSAPLVALSYSSDGHVADDTIRDILSTHGTLQVHEFERRRYRSSALAHKAATVTERLYIMQR